VGNKVGCIVGLIEVDGDAVGRRVGLIVGVDVVGMTVG
jgi:hypothetical protein